MRLAKGLLVALCAFSAAPTALAETRIALIIGNGDYADPNLKLGNPVNDARAMQTALRDAHFETVVKLNVTRREFYRAVDEFGARIRSEKNAVALFYYAGHGVQADGVNYLIPVDAAIESQSDLEASGFNASRLMQAMEGNDMNIVILDACRDNPLPKTRGIERGLARMSAPSGTFIGYAAAPGQTAHDGAKGSNGVFTGELVKAMAKPGLPLEQVFKQVIAGVRTDTHDKQRPWSEASIQGDFYFLDPLPQAGDVVAWKAIESSHNPGDFRNYLTTYPQGAFSDLAQVRLNNLTASKDPIVKPPPPHREPASTKDQRCESLDERTHLGESLDDDDRKYQKEKCH